MFTFVRMVFLPSKDNAGKAIHYSTAAAKIRLKQVITAKIFETGKVSKPYTFQEEK